MKFNRIILILSAAWLLAGCSDDLASAGAGALRSDEQVLVCSTTLGGIRSRTDSLKNFDITQTPDSFLIGECNTSDWATIKADLLTQFACPVGIQFPDSSHIDSIALVMTYSSWFGDGNSPLRITVYEMDRNTFVYEEQYTCLENLYDYWSGEDSTHAVQADRVVVAANPPDSVYSDDDSKYYPYIRFMMNDRLVKKLNSLPNHTFPSQKEFNQLFKGLYITTTQGSSTALYVDNITMVIYYHYYYESEPGVYQKAKDMKYLYANSEVRQVNRYDFPYKSVMVPQLQADSDSINYIVSPAYVYTVLSLPLGQYVDAINDSVASSKSLRPYINKALITLNIINGANNSTINRWAEPANDMLLIAKDSLQSFFAKSNVPSADYCLFSTLKISIDSLYHYHYCYSFDLSTILQNALRSNSRPDELEMVLIPVHVEYSTTSTDVMISKVKINQTITFTMLQSAQDKTNPMSIDAVFSGFSITGL